MKGCGNYALGCSHVSRLIAIKASQDQQESIAQYEFVLWAMIQAISSRQENMWWKRSAQAVLENVSVLHPASQTKAVCIGIYLYICTHNHIYIYIFKLLPDFFFKGVIVCDPLVLSRVYEFFFSQADPQQDSWIRPSTSDLPKEFPKPMNF